MATCKSHTTVKRFGWFWQSLLRSYSQVLFSNNAWFGGILLIITFIDFYVGLAGLVSVLTALFAGSLIGLSDYKIKEGYYGFNALLVGVGLGVYFEPGLLLLTIIFFSGILTAFVAVALEGVIGKYGLPFLSLPFMVTFWILMLASREFVAIGLNERGVYVLNDLYALGGHTLVRIYEEWNELPVHTSLRTYFLSLSAIFFQHNILAGILASLGLLLFSRIAFTLSFVGFYVAYIFYLVLGIPFTETTFSYVGFNYILIAIALGGFFIIPNRNTFLAIILIVPMVVILTIALLEIFTLIQLPVHSFPFNIATLTFLYVLKFRVDNRINLNAIFWQQNSPERNLYNFVNFNERFGKETPIPIHVPFFGEWTVTQGHNGKYTHKDDWRHAWDFEITDDDGKTYKNDGDVAQDYYCFDKSIIAPADGTVEEVVDDIDDNTIGERNLEFNWGNTVVLKHSEFIFTKLSHLKQNSIQVKPGDKVKKGDVLAKCGNSGNSPYPHLHFQVQSTPYIGSKTIDYALSDVLVKKNNSVSLASIANPGEGAIVSALPVNPELKKAFTLVVGRKINFEIPATRETMEWEVKRDYLLNKYVECAKTKSRAYFKSDDAMLHFIHFEGDRKSLLYFFYLAAYKISFGFYNNLVLHDSLPVNMIFHPRKIVVQDFSAPFMRYLKGEYEVRYPEMSRSLADRTIRLTGSVKKKVFSKLVDDASFHFIIDSGGLRAFSFMSGKIKYEAQCTAN